MKFYSFIIRYFYGKIYFRSLFDSKIYASKIVVSMDAKQKIINRKINLAVETGDDKD